jgi:hypothetical protein
MGILPPSPVLRRLARAKTAIFIDFAAIRLYNWADRAPEVCEGDQSAVTRRRGELR